MHPRKLNLGQRIVAIISLAALLRVVGDYIVSPNPPDGGWFNYVPLSDVPSFSRASLGAVFVWALLIAAWAIASIWLLGLSHNRSAGTPDTGAAP
jgi:heme/copper-type cytochrome/quinol oxidase subunit 1